MSDLKPVNEWDVEQVSAAWLASTAAGGDLDDRVVCWLEKWFTASDYMAMWHLVLKLCEDVASENSIGPALARAWQ